MKKTFISNNPKQTRKLGEVLASELRGGESICLTGELGSGKTTFSQGVLEGLGAKGPYMSPTFVVMKQYNKFAKVRPFPPAAREQRGSSRSNLPGFSENQTFNVYHIDAYRVGSKDVLDLGWEEIISNKNNIVIVEWAERIKSIVPKRAVWMEFEHVNNNIRKIAMSINPNIKAQTSNQAQNLKSKF